MSARPIRDVESSPIIDAHERTVRRISHARPFLRIEGDGAQQALGCLALIRIGVSIAREGAELLDELLDGAEAVARAAGEDACNLRNGAMVHGSFPFS
ncbi:MAG: hypothetical protein KIT84_05125 [Labilithrix sp.]|nr:hypothetical protein [Labilithrix sp.]MCW5810369.1 hypothetical protein [Labilithrix sp.]